MGRIIDVAKVQEALDRAARNAVHGSQDVRAGRFVAGDASASLPNRRSRTAKPHSLAQSSDAQRDIDRRRKGTPK